MSGAEHVAVQCCSQSSPQQQPQQRRRKQQHWQQQLLRQQSEQRSASKFTLQLSVSTTPAKKDSHVFKRGTKSCLNA